MSRKKIQPSESEPGIKLGIKQRLVLLAVLLAAIALFLGFMWKQSTHMLTKMQDRPKAIAEIVKACGAEAQAKGLKNADAMKHSAECSKAKTAELDAKGK
jgi:hypothetical protein